MAKKSKRGDKADAVAAEVARLRRREKKLARRVKALEDHLDEMARRRREWRRRMESFSPGPGGKGRGPRPPFGPGFGGPRGPRQDPVISVEVPIESDDPTNPVWANVSARLPEEIPVVEADGQISHYRYSAVGSTAQAPRYRKVARPGREEPK